MVYRTNDVHGTSNDYLLEVAKGAVENHIAVDKWGANPDIDTTTDPEDVWAGGGLYTGFPTGSAETMEILSDDANDTSEGSGAQTVKITNLLDATGAMADDVTVSLDGVTPKSLGATTYTRASRIIVLTAGATGSNEGNLTLRHSTTTANIFAYVPIGLNQTSQLTYTVPLGYTLYVNHFRVGMGVSAGASGSSSIIIQRRPSGGVFNAVANPIIVPETPYAFDSGWKKFLALEDIKVNVSEVTVSNTTVTAEFQGVLVSDSDD